MILSVCSDKGSPGVSTICTALGTVWPSERVVVEMDPAGGDLAFRLRSAGTAQRLSQLPSVLSLAAGARSGVAPDSLLQFSQLCSLGFGVIPGALTAEAYAPMARLWPQVAGICAQWQGTAIADLGRMQPGNPALTVARASEAVLLVARPSLEGLYHLRDRVNELSSMVGDTSRERNPLAVVVVAPARDGDRALDEVRRMLDAAGSPVPVAGMIAADDKGTRAMWDGTLTKKSEKSALLSSARALTRTLLAWWPDLPRAIPGQAPDARLDLTKPGVSDARPAARQAQHTADAPSSAVPR
ncbi:MAG: hypothetical protein M3Y42_11820 [Actinomycetota bacterium]|nr:hypothetical protein [Actinomycetota bacterium]MDQ2957640.1 hypothetical protein [Actinomycetota bacterium]